MTAPPRKGKTIPPPEAAARRRAPPGAVFSPRRAPHLEKPPPGRYNDPARDPGANRFRLEDMTMAEPKKHIAYLDCLRLFSALGVIYMHTAASGLRAGVTRGWHFMNLGTSLAFTAVPIFFMISGFLLLSDEKTLRADYLVKRRLPRLLVPLAVFTLCAALWSCVETKDFSFAHIYTQLRGALYQPILIPFWFMYTLLAVYLLSPLLCGGVRAIGKGGGRYLLVLIAGILMTGSAYFGIKSLTIISYIAVPAVAILGTVAMILAVKSGDTGLVEQFAKGTKDLGVIAGAGLVIGSFVSGGTATPNFSRFAKTPKVGLIVTVVAFFIGNSLMFLFGAVSSIYVGGNDIFEVMLNLNLFYLAILVLGLNIWTTNDNALYTSGLGLSNIFGLSKKTMVLIAGLIGTVTAVWLYWNFCGWLNVLNCTLPPIGIILTLSYFMNRKAYLDDTLPKRNVNWAAVIGVVAGAVVANLVKWGIPSINGMAVATVCYLCGAWLDKKAATK